MYCYASYLHCSIKCQLLIFSEGPKYDQLEVPFYDILVEKKNLLLVSKVLNFYFKWCFSAFWQLHKDYEDCLAAHKVKQDTVTWPHFAHALRQTFLFDTFYRNILYWLQLLHLCKTVLLGLAVSVQRVGFWLGLDVHGWKSCRSYVIDHIVCSKWNDNFTLTWNHIWDMEVLQTMSRDTSAYRSVWPDLCHLCQPCKSCHS